MVGLRRGRGNQVSGPSCLGGADEGHSGASKSSFGWLPSVEARFWNARSRPGSGDGCVGGCHL
jgi:hypothetical protein